MGCNGSKKASAPPSGGGSASTGGTAKGDDNKQLLAEYVLGDVLGQGAFGVVYSCAKKDTKDYKYAVKMVDKVETPVAEIKKEAAVMQELAHPNVVCFHAVYFEKCFVCIVMDKYGGGDLIEGMQLHWKTKGKIPIMNVMHIVRGMAASINHLHSKLYVHRDVKGDNYLTDMKDITDPKCRILMSDFGTAVKLKSPTERLRSSCGTKIYWPPEFYSMNYSFKVDTWALGVIMYGLCDGRFPFKNEQDVRIKKIKLPATVPPKCVDLINGLLEKTEEKRLDGPNLMSHPFLKEGAPAAPAATNDGDKDWAAEGMREGGANGDQDERRRELIDRLEKAAERKKGPSATQMAVLWGSRFDVNDKRTGKSTRYEWWNPDKFATEKIIDLDNAIPLGADVGKVDVTTVNKMLSDHGIDTSRFGKGDAKTMEQFANEVHAGAAILMLDAQHHKKLVRVVDVVLLRITDSGSGANKRYLTEFAETFADGRNRDNLARLPGTKKEPHENTKKTVDRIIQQIIGVDPLAISVSIKDKEVFEEEEDSRSFPGVTTVYRKEIVEGTVVSKDATVLQKMGLNTTAPSDKFSHADSSRNTKTFKWLTEANCAKQKIKLKAPAEGEEVSGLIQAPCGYTEEQLYKFLEENKVDPTAFGQKNTKTLKEFSNELLKGEASLMVDTDGKVVRTADIVVLILKKQGVGDILVEAKETYADGQTSELKRVPGTKRRPDENHFVTAQRLLKRQLKMDENCVSLNSAEVKVIEEKKDSPSYPGISTLYRKRVITAELLRLEGE
eukprot:TRINITY_DN7992_c0_g1_i2.p1 TRINITY_DN7992_c0_g1~~TRINITY_DN7992_c0_g1_i2.p1  ORF type:complete len:782 (-),score=239.19 TRINITY_DN7992_c0_g1_i2:130-2475(-)